MTNNIYVIYNKMTKRYGDCVAYPTDEYCQYVTKNTIKAGKYDPEMCEMCRIGAIDIDTGVATFEAPVRIKINIDNKLTE